MEKGRKNKIYVVTSVWITPRNKEYLKNNHIPLRVLIEEAIERKQDEDTKHTTMD